MTRAAELGRGTFTHIGSVEQVEERMRGLFDKLESPAVTDLTATFSEREADVTPAVLPDLYRGEPLVLAAQLAALDGHGRDQGPDRRPARGSSRCRSPTPPKARACPSSGRGARSPTPRSRARCGSITPEEADKRILALALDHQLVTRLTSLVAVDKTPSRPEGAPLTLAELPLNLPAGWDFDKVFGERPQPASRLHERRADATRRRAACQLAMAKRSRDPRRAASRGTVVAAEDRDRRRAAR